MLSIVGDNFAGMPPHPLFDSALEPH